MVEHSFSLLPFNLSSSPSFTIKGRISRQSNILALQYILSGDLSRILLPSRTEYPERRHELWKTTCFECFLARKDQPLYWEVNLSPSGDWNIYRMDAYRRVGFREEERLSQLQLEMRENNGSFSLRTVVDLSPVFSESDVLEASITAIIVSTDGTETYWALTHAGQQADFHIRSSFTLELAGQTRSSNQPVPGD